MPKKAPKKRSKDDMIAIDHVVDTKKLKKGDIISNTEYFIVDNSDDDYVQVRTLCGSKSISSCLLKYGSYKTQTQFNNTEKVCRSKLIEIIRDDVKSHTFLVEFKKKDGSPRTMTCHLKTFCGLFGRSEVLELVEKDGKFLEQKRLIDHRTISRLVFDGTEYISTSK